MTKVKRISGGYSPDHSPVGTIGELMSTLPLPEYGVKVKTDKGIEGWDRRNCELIEEPKQYAQRINEDFGEAKVGDIIEVTKIDPDGTFNLINGHRWIRHNGKLMPKGYDPECMTTARCVTPQRIFQTANASQIIAMDFAAVEAKVAAAYVMSKDELFALHSSTSAACLEVMKKKNHDYTSGGSVFANFKDSSILGISPVMGILLRCIDKFKRIQTFESKGTLAVEGEGVLDAVDDVINYMILVKGIIIERQKNKA